MKYQYEDLKVVLKTGRIIYSIHVLYKYDLRLYKKVFSYMING